MIEEFQAATNIEDNKLIITTQGYINNQGGEKILNTYKELSNDNIKHVIMDLAGTKVVNSIGVSYVIELIENMNSKGQKLIFANLNSAVEKTFTIMGIFQFSTHAENLEKAKEMAQ